MAWLIKVGGAEFNSDDFTIEELGEVERVSGVPWSIANPLREIKVAKAFIAVALLHADRTQDQVAEQLAELTLRQLKVAFEYHADADEEEEGEDVDPSAQLPALTSPGSSRGERAEAGRPARPAKSA